MNLNPQGNWILVEVIRTAETKEESVVLIPEDYKKPDNPYSVVKVIRDSGSDWNSGDLLLVPVHIIRDVEINQNTFYMIERNHIMAEVEE